MLKYIFPLFLINISAAQSITQAIPQDKQRHFAMGVCIAAMTYITAYDHYNQKNPKTSHLKSLAAANVLTISAALLTVVYDYNVYSSAGLWNGTKKIDSYEDIFATVLGSAAVTLVIHIGSGR
jgi:hypothetical protein